MVTDPVRNPGSVLGREPAFPFQGFVHPVSGHVEWPEYGLSKREYIAALVLSGLAAYREAHDVPRERLVRCAVDVADALLAELHRTE